MYRSATTVPRGTSSTSMTSKPGPIRVLGPIGISGLSTISTAVTFQKLTISVTFPVMVTLASTRAPLVKKDTLSRLRSNGYITTNIPVVPSISDGVADVSIGLGPALSVFIVAHIPCSGSVHVPGGSSQ